MVINISALKDGDDSFVEEDIRAVVKASAGAVVKVIIETCLLTDEEKVRACQLAVKAGADFVKTSTGFSTGGATAADVALMRKTVGGKAGVKASGGIRTPEDAAAMIEAGADRIGAGNGIVLAAGRKTADGAPADGELLMEKCCWVTAAGKLPAQDRRWGTACRNGMKRVRSAPERWIKERVYYGTYGKESNSIWKLCGGFDGQDTAPAGSRGDGEGDRV